MGVMGSYKSIGQTPQMYLNTRSGLIEEAALRVQFADRELDLLGDPMSEESAQMRACRVLYAAVLDLLKSAPANLPNLQAVHCLSAWVTKIGGTK